MVDLIELTNAFVTTLQGVPPLVAALSQGSPDSVVAYIDSNPTKNSVSMAQYQMKPGTVMVAWQNTVFSTGDMEAWAHTVTFYVRALRDTSALSLMKLIVDGIPVPGDGLRWRYCPVLPGLLPTTVTAIERVIDEEGIDYFTITTETKETGDL